MNNTLLSLSLTFADGEHICIPESDIRNLFLKRIHWDRTVLNTDTKEVSTEDVSFIVAEIEIKNYRKYHVDNIPLSQKCRDERNIVWVTVSYTNNSSDSYHVPWKELGFPNNKYQQTQLLLSEDNSYAYLLLLLS